MSDHVERTIEMVLAQIAELERQLAEKRKTVNVLCPLVSRPPMFPEAEQFTSAALREDEFYGKPLATAVEDVLERRKATGYGAATVGDIYETLVRGGFHFATKNAENAKRNLYTSLSKNTKFHKLPNGSYGLTEWYPNARKNRDIEDQGDSKVGTSSPNGAEHEEEEEGLAEAKKTFDENGSEKSKVASK